MSSVAVVTPGINPALAVRSGSALRAHLEASLGESLSSTLLLRERVPPATVSTGIAALDVLTGGLARGALSEIVGPDSSGRTGVMLASLAAATCRQEVCALVDASDSFDPASAAAAGVDLDRLLWIRCTPRSSTLKTKDVKWGYSRNVGFAFGEVLEQVLKVTDLLLQGGGFGVVVLDLGDIPAESARRVPLTTWFRFRRAVEPTATVLLLIEQQPCAKTCASLVVRLRSGAACTSYSSACSLPPPLALNFSKQAADAVREDTEDCRPFIPEEQDVSHAMLFRGIRFRAEVVRLAVQRKPPQSSGASFELRTAL